MWRDLKIETWWNMRTGSTEGSEFAIQGRRNKHKRQQRGRTPCPLNKIMTWKTQNEKGSLGSRWDPPAPHTGMGKSSTNPHEKAKEIWEGVCLCFDIIHQTALHPAAGKPGAIKGCGHQHHKASFPWKCMVRAN